MRTIPIFQVDSFTRTPFHGNPAGVVLDARSLSDDTMQAVAREMNLSETAFVLPPDSAGGRYRIRWFTPATEVEFCGHATLAAAHCLAESGLLAKSDRIVLSMDARIGTLEVSIDRASGGFDVMITVPLSPFESVDDSFSGCYLDALHLEAGDLDGSLPIQRYRSKLFIPVAELDTLADLKPDFQSLFELGRDLGVAACPLTLETSEPTSAVHLRFFAPFIGIAEDPVTGAANAPLGAYLARHGVLDRLVESGRATRKDGPPRVYTYVAEQGDEVKRPGRPRVEVTVAADGTMSVRVGGNAVTVLRGELTVP